MTIRRRFQFLLPVMLKKPSEKHENHNICLHFPSHNMAGSINCLLFILSLCLIIVNFRKMQRCQECIQLLIMWIIKAYTSCVCVQCEFIKWHLCDEPQMLCANKKHFFHYFSSFLQEASERECLRNTQKRKMCTHISLKCVATLWQHKKLFSFLVVVDVSFLCALAISLSVLCQIGRGTFLLLLRIDLLTRSHNLLQI
jgi:hypothetical protein